MQTLPPPPPPPPPPLEGFSPPSYEKTIATDSVTPKRPLTAPFKERLYSDMGVSRDEFLTQTGISLDDWRKGNIPQAVKSLHKEGERFDELNIQGKPYIKVGGKPTSLYKKIEAYPITATTSPLFNIGGVNVSASDIVALGLIAYGGYQGAKVLPQLFKSVGDKALQGALNTGLDKWIAQRSRGVPAQKFKTLQDILYNQIVKNKTWLQERATENMLSRMGRGVNKTQAASQAVEEVIKNFENELLPKLTVTNTAVPGQKFTMAEIISGLTGKPPSVQAVQGVRGELPIKPVTPEVAKQSLDEIMSAKHPQVDAFVSERENSIKLHTIDVPKGQRRKGIGTTYMEDLIAHADETGKTITLSTGGREGDIAKSKLIAFYKSFGFVENKGRKKDYRISDTMYRRPVTPQAVPSEIQQAAQKGVTPEVTSRTQQIDQELAKLQVRYEKLLAEPQGARPPAVQKDRLDGIAKQMDKLNSERERLSAPKAEVTPPISAQVEAPRAEAMFGEADAGLQKSMLGEVPEREVRIAGKGKITQTSMDDLQKLMQVKGKLPAGMGTRAEAKLEIARREAEKYLQEITSPADLDSAIEQAQAELSNRSLPYHGAARHNLFPEYDVKQLDEYLNVLEAGREAPTTAPTTPVAPTRHEQLREATKGKLSPIGTTIKFIRYGQPVSYSTDWQSGKRLKGMSVYELGETGASKTTVRGEFSDKPNIYIGRGKVVGYGSDDEPLVSNYTIRKATLEEAERAEYYGLTRKEYLKEIAPPEVVSKGISAEDTAVTEVSGVAPPKPPKDWDKIGGELYDRFKRQSSEPTPNTVPIAGRLQRARGKVEKVVTDEFARLNALGWQAELDVAMIRASGTQSGQVYKETMKSIAKSIGNDSNLLSYVDDYLMLRHQLEVLKATGRKYFIIKKGESSKRFTASQIGLLFAQMKKELGVGNYARVKEAASHVPAVYNQILRGTQELTPGQIEGLIKKYPWYNPILFRNDTVPANITRKLSPRQVRELTTLESDKENISPLMSLPTTIAKRMKAQAINDAKKSISELAVEPDNATLIGGGVEIVAKKPDGAFIDYFDKGERKYLKLGKGSEWLAQDIEMFQRQPPSMLIKMVRSLQNLSKMFFTTYNPGFVAWNTAFDGMVAYFSEGISPWGFGETLAGNIKGMFTDVPGLNEFRRSGGELFGFFEKGSREGLGFGEGEKSISPYVSKKGGRLVLKNPESLKRFINPFTLIRELGVAGENAARRATYEKAIKEGLSPKEATIRARRVSVDFSRFSTASRVINDWFIYFNPAMQGLLLPGRAIAKNPRTLWRLSALVAGYLALTFYNQGYDEYNDVRDSDKVGKLLVMLPSDEYNKYGQKVPHYLTLLPLREFAAFTAPIEYLMGRLRTEEPEAYRSLGQEFGVLFPSVSPLSMISESGGIVMPTQIGATIQQIQQNHDDFRNRPIIDDEMELLPASQQYDQYTNSLAIRIGQALNMSPKKLDFFVSNMFGSLGQDCLRTMDLAIQGLDKEKVDARIVGLVNDLRTIQTNVPPNQIEVARETFLEGLSAEDREIVLNMERLPDEDFPFMASILRRFIRDYGGQVYATAKEKALAARTLEDYPPEALEELQGAAVENANNLLSDKITKYQYDQNRTRYRAYYSGSGTAEWRQSMIEGAVARSEVDQFMPETYKRAKEFQAVSSYMEIRQKYIDESGGVLDSDGWDKIEQDTLREMGNHYSETEIQYAVAHKDDWIDKLPEPARTMERQRAKDIEDETWWDNYRGQPTSTPKSTPSSKKWIPPWKR